MKKIFVAMLTTLVVLGGCLTEDYNLRVIRDSERTYIGKGEPDTGNRLRWTDADWSTSHAKVWGSAGVIITNEYNLFDDDADTVKTAWLRDVIDTGFEGLILLDYNPDIVPTSWATAIEGSYGREVYNSVFNAGKSLSTRTLKVDGTSDEVVAVDEMYGNVNFINPVAFSDEAGFSGELIGILENHINALSTKFDFANKNIEIGIQLAHFDYQSYWPMDKYSIGDQIDPYDLGRPADNYSLTDMNNFDDYYDDIVNA